MSTSRDRLAYAHGWCKAAEWAKRTDLKYDMGSRAYLDDMRESLRNLPKALGARAMLLETLAIIEVTARETYKTSSMTEDAFWDSWKREEPDIFSRWQDISRIAQAMED